jgi:hypothetical protein
LQLILNTFGASLRKKDGMFLIKSGDRKMTVSPRKVQTIWLATGVHLSTDAIRLALEHHIDIALLDKHGEPYGRFWHARLGSTTLLRRRLLEAAGTTTDRFAKHLHAFCTAERGPILEKFGSEYRWKFRFTNPSMQPYVLMKGLRDGLITEVDCRLDEKPKGMLF